MQLKQSRTCTHEHTLLSKQHTGPPSNSQLSEGPSKVTASRHSCLCCTLNHCCAAGALGYQVGALKNRGKAFQEQHQLSSITFADDINILTGGRNALPNLKHQTGKVSAYANWGKLLINNTKTTVTGALHGTQPNKPYDDERLKTQLTNTIRMQGKPITYHPPRESFRHLGILLTMDLNFKPQLRAILATVREMTKSLRHSYASTRQKERIIRTEIRPAITYAFAVAPYTAA